MALTRFHVLLEEKIKEEADKLRETITSGRLADYDEYRWHVGCLWGLKMCLKLCDDIEGEFDERNRAA